MARKRLRKLGVVQLELKEFVVSAGAQSVVGESQWRPKEFVKNASEASRRHKSLGAVIQDFFKRDYSKP